MQPSPEDDIARTISMLPNGSMEDATKREAREGAVQLHFYGKSPTWTPSDALCSGLLYKLSSGCRQWDSDLST